MSMLKVKTNNEGSTMLAALRMLLAFDCLREGGSATCIGRWKGIKTESCPCLFIAFFLFFLPVSLGKAGARAGWVAPRNSGGIPFIFPFL